MKTNNKFFKIVAYSVTSIFFLGFVYFSFFTMKELLVLKYVSPNDYVHKFYSWKVEECKFHTPSFVDAEKIGEKKISTRECLQGVENVSKDRMLADFKYNFIKYGLATFFFFLLFIAFSSSLICIHKKKK